MIAAISFIAVMAYLSVLVYLLNGFRRLPEFKRRQGIAETRFSIVVPFRDEAKNIEILLRSLMNLEYPEELFEVIFVDDDSDDDSVAIIERQLLNSKLSWKILPNQRTSGAPKKDAITTAIAASREGWVVTTDADCQLPPHWLSCLNQFVQDERPAMICGPVSYTPPVRRSLLITYQIVEGLGLQGVTMGAFGFDDPMLCNGANLAYERQRFVEVEGFAGNTHLASGDDVFLMDKFQQRYPGGVRFLKSKEATVLTQLETSWSSVLQQRIRWAAKTSKQRNIHSKFVALTALIANLCVITMPVLAAVLRPSFFFPALLMFLLKCYGDFIYFQFLNSFFKIRVGVASVLTIALAYPFISSFIALRSLFGGYRWKGRDFRR